MNGNDMIWTWLLNNAIYETFMVIGMYLVFINALNINGRKRKIFFACFYIGMITINEIILVQHHIESSNRELTVATLAIANTIFYVIVLKLLTEMDYLHIFLADTLAQIVTATIMSIPYIAVAAIFHRDVDILFSLEINFQNIFVGIILVLVMIVTLFILRYISQRWLSGFYKTNIKWKPAFWGLILIFNGAGYVVCIKNNIQSKESIILPAVAMACSLICVLYGASWFVRYRQEKQIREENMVLSIENTVMKEYYNTLEYQLEHTRKFRHDIEKHMSVIKEMLEKRESNHINTSDADEEKHAGTSSLKQLNEMISEEYLQMDEERYCNSPIINAMLANKKRMCKKEKIGLKIQVSEIELGNIKEMDFIAVVANLLDNAIEECRNVQKEYEQKTNDLKEKEGVPKIEFSCSSGEGISIMVCNTTQKEEVSKGGTTKKDTYAHGVGLSIVNEVVNKYKGTIKVSINNGKYETKIVLGG